MSSTLKLIAFSIISDIQIPNELINVIFNSRILKKKLLKETYIACYKNKSKKWLEMTMFLTSAFL